MNSRCTHNPRNHKIMRMHREPNMRIRVAMADITGLQVAYTMRT
ncbi:MAG: hypothetical protein U1F35_14335 [Steroidobacteraceae bacterium]